jgi:uncharacterized RmlC-like cupin family protein
MAGDDHEGIETIAYMLEGECAVYHGNNLQKGVLMRQGEQARCRGGHGDLPGNAP